MKLRSGKTKRILDSSIDAAMLAVEVYNKPRTAYRSEAYITLMINAWTKLFHAHFNKTIGDRYYYKKKGAFELFDGEKKAWELGTCIKKYKQLLPDVESNLDFFILLRNRIEHRYVSSREIDNKIFGECQSLLYNYENQLILFFGESFALNESLAFSLQFSKIRNSQQDQSSRQLLKKEMQDIHSFIDSYRRKLTDDIYLSQSYSIKLIQIPKIASGSRNDLAVEFVNWNDLTDDEKLEIPKLTAIIREKNKYVYNPDCYKPGKLIEIINGSVNTKLTFTDNLQLAEIFDIRPFGINVTNPFLTNDLYCLYDGVHEDYVYTKLWAAFLINLINVHKWHKASWKGRHKRGEKHKVEDYPISLQKKVNT